METRIGLAADIPGIIALQAQNLLANLAVDQLSDGFKLNWQLVAEFEFNSGNFYGLAHDLKLS